MKEINLAELKELQLQILISVDEFCFEHSIKYSLAFGTLLGAVRHKGYIPWDDDIDIMMPREDYELFVQKFTHPRYSTISYQKESKFVIPYGKVIDNNTILIEDSTMDFPIGVNIDVFPIDTCPPLAKENLWFKKKYLIDGIYTIRKLRLEKDRSLIKNILVVLIRLLTFPISLGMLCNMIQKEATKYLNRTNPEKKGILCTGDTKRCWLISSEIFNEFEDISFEGKTFRSIKDIDSYLSATYGDYIVLPPEDKRVRHHGFKAYWI